MKRLILLFPFLFPFLIGCQDVIDLSLEEGEKRIIINGRVSDTLPVYVDIYATANYLSASTNPRISNVTVNLYENEVLVATLVENDTVAGNYIDPFIGSEGNSYFIEVIVPEGHPYFSNTRWVSAPEVMRRIVPADSSYYQYQLEKPFFDEGYYAYVMFTEPAGLGDSYRQRIWRNDTLWNTQYDINVFNDEFIDGRSFDDIDLPATQIGTVAKAGDIYKVELSSISAEGYNFLLLLQEQTVQVGSTFDPPPAPIFGNIVNADDPNRLGLGYFFASRLTYEIIEIKE